jgi:hypothetical protein
MDNKIEFRTKYYKLNTVIRKILFKHISQDDLNFLYDKEINNDMLFIKDVKMLFKIVENNLPQNEDDDENY